MKPESNQNNKIDKFKNQFKPVKTVTFKKKKKMDKKNILQIQLLIKSLFLEGELDPTELENPELRQEIKITIMSQIENIFDTPKDIELKEDYEKCVEKFLLRGIRVKPPRYSPKQIKSIEEQIKFLKTIPQPEQRTPEWYKFRNNRLTASDLGTIIGVNPYETYNKIVQKKCGFEAPFFMNKHIKRGVKYEEVITNIYEFRNKVKVFEYGCIPHPTIGHFGASPDGIVDSCSENKNYIGRMLEIKCPGARPITGFCPEYYYAQVQGQLEVCDLELCDFVECKIEDYESKMDYFDDFYLLPDGSVDYHYSKSGLEKGIVIEAYDKSKGKEKYYYGKLGMNYQQAYLWEQDIIENSILTDDNLDYLNTTYWYATEYNELLIHRRKEWFHRKCIPLINKFWEDVQHYRTKPMEEIESLVKTAKKKEEPPKIDSFVTTNAPPPSLFLSDSDDD